MDCLLGIYSQEAEKEQEVRSGDKASIPAANDILSQERLFLLKV